MPRAARFPILYLDLPSFSLSANKIETGRLVFFLNGIDVYEFYAHGIHRRD